MHSAPDRRVEAGHRQVATRGASATGVRRSAAEGLLALQRGAGNAAVTRLLRGEPATNVLLEPLPVSPPQMRVLGTYSDEQLSSALYGRPGVPIRHVGSDTVEISYSTLLPQWKTTLRDAVTGWEKTGPEERERVGHRAADGSIVWEIRPRWTPVTDRSRGGMVVGYKRSSGGYTELRNTAGKVVFTGEIPITSVRIPVVDDVADALAHAGCAAVGVADAWLEDNWRALGLPPHPSPLGSILGIPSNALAYRIGRGAGHLVSLLQAAAEMVSGAAVVAGGAGELLVAVATTPAGGAGLVVMPIAVVTVAAGASVIVHGGALAGAVFMSATTGGGGDGGGRRRKDDLKQVDDVAKEFRMSKEQRESFGEFLEAEKGAGNGGSANSRGDFTYRELRAKAAEFLELYGR